MELVYSCGRNKVGVIAREDMPRVVRQTMIVKNSSMNRGRVVTDYKYEGQDPRDYFKDYNVSDFFMDNLIAAGAVPVNACEYYDGNVDEFLSKVDRYLDEQEKK